MSTQNLKRENLHLFEWHSGLSLDQFIFVDYYIESVLDPELAAFSMAQEQSLTATGEEVLKRDVDLSTAAVRVYNVAGTGTGPGPLLPFYLINEPFSVEQEQVDCGPYHGARVTLAYPVQNLGSCFTDMWNCIYGELPRHGILNAFRVLDIRMPEVFVRRLPGPALGVSGLRRSFGVKERPFFCRSMQPAVGLTTEQMLEINEAVLRGGFDIVKDDELGYDSELSPIRDRFKRIAALTEKLSAQLNQPKRYIANIISSPVQGMDLLAAAESAGADGVLVSPALQGMEFIRDVRTRTHLPIMAHNTGDDTMTRQPRLGVHPALLIKLYRLLGADIVMLPGSAATCWQDEAEIRQCVRACFDPIAGVKPALPVLAGGKTPECLNEYIELIGTPDFMLIVATALNTHPGGLSAGAAEFVRAWAGRR